VAKTLGPILWDFSKLYISFMWQGNEVILVGLAAPKNKLLEGPKMLKELHQHYEGVLLQLFTVQLGWTNNSRTWKHRITANAGSFPRVI
jgi:hypothetical protein